MRFYPKIHKNTVIMLQTKQKGKWSWTQNENYDTPANTKERTSIEALKISLWE